MKKTLAILAVLVLACASVFAQAAAEAPAKKGPVTLAWWDNYANLAETHQAILDEYEAATGNHVELQNYDGTSYKEALDLAIRSGQSPDILSAKPWGTNNIAQKYTEGVIAPLTVDSQLTSFATCFRSSHSLHQGSPSRHPEGSLRRLHSLRRQGLLLPYPGSEPLRYALVRQERHPE